jgi:CBS domain-containing protein
MEKMMIDPYRRLSSLRVRDVMATHVIDVEVNQPIAHAAALLRKHNVSAAPVVDEQGRCVGFLSASDVMARQCAPSADSMEENQPETVCHDDNALQVEVVSGELVRHFMTSAVQTISETAPVFDAARVMMLEHIHRLPVLDEQGRPRGMISTMDIVAAMMNVLDESVMKQRNPMKNALNYAQASSEKE